MRYAVEIGAPPTVQVDDGTLFPVRRIWCVGRNYAEHAREMGSDPDKEPPFFFAKPADAVVADGATLPFPPKTQDLHHEIELVVAIGRPGRNLTPADAQTCVFGYAAGIDLTRRDLQAQAKKAARPWEMGKAFDRSAPCGVIRRAEGAPIERGAVTLKVNGETRQSGDLADLIWSVPELVAELSSYVELHPGDLIFTGTPSGVGPLHPGDHVEGSVEGVGEIRVTLTA